MPAEGVSLTKSDKLLTSNEIIKISNLFVQEGVTKIRLTGGEPTIRKDLVDIICKYFTDFLITFIYICVRASFIRLCCNFVHLVLIFAYVPSIYNR